MTPRNTSNTHPSNKAGHARIDAADRQASRQAGNLFALEFSKFNLLQKCVRAVRNSKGKHRSATVFEGVFVVPLLLSHGAQALQYPLWITPTPGVDHTIS